MLTLFLSNRENKSLVNNIFLSNNIYAIKYVLKFIKTEEHALRLNLDSVLIQLIQFSDCDKITCMLIEKLHSLDLLKSYIDITLHTAIEYKRFYVIRFLLLKGANAKFIDANGKCLLHHLIDNHQSELVQLIIEHYDVDVNSLNADGYNLIFAAISNNACTISSSLIELGTHIDCKDNSHTTLIERCIERNWYLHVNHIINKGGIDFIYNTHLFYKYCHIAIQVNSILIFDKLVKNYFAYKIQKMWKVYKRRT
jgi:ankyrin repeat protein